MTILFLFLIFKTFHLASELLMKTSSDSSFLVNYRSAKSSKDLRGVEENTYTCLKLELGMPVDDIGGLVMVMIRGLVVDT